MKYVAWNVLDAYTVGMEWLPPYKKDTHAVRIYDIKIPLHYAAHGGRRSVVVHLA